MSKHRPTPVPTAGGFLDEIEAHIDEDAAAAAPVDPVADDAGDAEDEGGGRTLPQLPPLEDSGPPTEAWHSEPMDFFSSGNDKAAESKPECGPAPLRCHGIRLDRLSSGQAARALGKPPVPSAGAVVVAVVVVSRGARHGRRRRRRPTARPPAVKTSSVPVARACRRPQPRSRSRSRAPGPRCEPSMLDDGG